MPFKVGFHSPPFAYFILFLYNLYFDSSIWGGSSFLLIYSNCVWKIEIEMEMTGNAIKINCNKLRLPLATPEMQRK